VEPGWRGAALTSSFDGGASWQSQGQTAGAAVMGRALTALAPGASALIDSRSSVEVQLLNDEMWLEGRNDAALVAGANLALLGDELIQFGVAEPLGGGRFRLSRLLRGRSGTEWAGLAHAAGDPFLVIERQRLVAIEAPADMLGGEVRLMAQGIGDGTSGIIESRIVEGRALQPPSPVHLCAERGQGGDILISWVRRSRIGWSWLNEADTPLGEESERYRLSISGAGFERIIDLALPSYVYSAALQGEDGVTEALTVRVAQIGTRALSPAAAIVI
jgi:hypothetical protein